MFLHHLLPVWPSCVTVAKIGHSVLCHRTNFSFQEPQRCTAFSLECSCSAPGVNVLTDNNDLILLHWWRCTSIALQMLLVWSLQCQWPVRGTFLNGKVDWLYCHYIVLLTCLICKWHCFRGFLVFSCIQIAGRQCLLDFPAKMSGTTFSAVIVVLSLTGDLDLSTADCDNVAAFTKLCETPAITKTNVQNVQCVGKLKILIMLFMYRLSFLKMWIDKYWYYRKTKYLLHIWQYFTLPRNITDLRCLPHLL